MHPKTKTKIQKFVEKWDYLKNVYLWIPPKTASERRYFEGQHSMLLTFKNEGVSYECEIDIRCSCKNIYATKSILVDGIKKDIRALRRLLRKSKK